MDLIVVELDGTDLHSSVREYEGQLELVMEDSGQMCW